MNFLEALSLTRTYHNQPYTNRIHTKPDLRRESTMNCFVRCKNQFTQEMSSRHIDALIVEARLIVVCRSYQKISTKIRMTLQREIYIF